MSIVLNGTTGITTPDVTSDSYTGALAVNASAPNDSLVVDASGNLGIGTSGPTQKLTVVGNIKAGYDANTGVNLGLVGSVPSSDNNAYILWGADTVFGGINGDLIYIPRTSTTASHRFYAGSGTPAERVRIDSDGLKFNGDTSAANALDDYEEGTFTGTLTGGTTAPSTPITAIGYYTKVGRLVEISITFANKDNTGASGTVTVTGLPFTSASTVIHLGAVVNTRGPNEQSSSYVSTGASSLIQVNYAGSQTAWTSAGAGVYAYFSIVYPAA